MQHFDEHTLALFALGEGQTPQEREAIAAHIALCSGCRAQVEELRQINQHVAESLAGESLPVVRKMTGLAPRNPAMSRYVDATPARARKLPAAALVRVAEFVRRHPAGSSSFAVLCALAAFFAVRTVWKGSVDVATDAQENPARTAIQIVDHNGSHLWDIPIHDSDEGMQRVALWGNALTRIVDLNGDGRTEVVTGSTYRDGEDEQLNVLRYYDGGGTLVAHPALAHSIVFRGGVYPMFFRITGVLAVLSSNAPTKDLLAGASGNRSPYVLTRLDAGGNILGEYWHYGWMPAMRSTFLDVGGHSVVALSGVNDVGDKADSGFAAIAILDPLRIIGRTESAASRGFGYDVSSAELYYIKADVPMLPFLGDSSIHVGNFRTMKVAQDSSLVFIYQSGTASGLPSYTYTFDPSMHLLSVSFDNISRQVLQEKYLRDKSAAVLDQYRQTLKEGIRYWDGGRWRKETTKVGEKTTTRR